MWSSAVQAVLTDATPWPFDVGKYILSYSRHQMHLSEFRGRNSTMHGALSTSIKRKRLQVRIAFFIEHS
jgi:hypothetical protein